MKKLCKTLLISVIAFVMLFIGNAEAKESKVYLSDIDYLSESRPGWGSIIKDAASNGNKISVKVEGAYYTFDKGMWAHATSTLVYDIRDYDYKYFTTYAALNNSAASSSNGVIFKIYTSKDKKDWSLVKETPVIKAGTNAEFIKINLKDVNYLKLVADSNGPNGNDHSVYADAQLTNEEESSVTDIKSVAWYDSKIKKDYKDCALEIGSTCTEQKHDEFELLLLQREFVNRAGPYALKRYAETSEENKVAFNWLFNNLENLRLYVLGGAPEGGSYYNSLIQLSRIYKAHSADFEDTRLLNNKWYPELTYGDLYKKMAITLSLTHSQRVALWMQPGAAENQSDAVKRYEIYKDLHKNGKFVVTRNADGTPNIDITPWFESLRIEEMRYVLNNALDDEETVWLNEYTQSYIDKYPKSAWGYLTPHPYMAYVWPNYGNPIFHDPDKKEYWDEKFNGIFSDYNVSYSKDNYKLYKVWMNFRNEFGTGAVCGGISKTGSNIRTSHGIPAVVIGQPGHAALLYYTKDANGKGYWNIDNDVSGWTLSEKGERLPLGWGSGSYARGSYQVVYITLAQEVLNNYDTFVSSEEKVMLADVYKDDLNKQEEIYRKALEIQPLNFDAWYGLIQNYNSNTKKTEDNYFDLAEELAEDLKAFPLPMYHLTNLIKPKLTTNQNLYRFALLQLRILNEASTLKNTTDKYYVYQPSITNNEAKYLLGRTDNSIATFSFSGDDENKIVLSSRFDGSGVRWDYSLDGKQTWNEVAFTAEEPHKLKLTSKEINSITSENDIYVHIVGVDYSEKNLFKIDITEQTLPATLYANDLENRIIGVNNNVEWRIKGESAWTSYSKGEPNLKGNKEVEIRVAANETKLTSPSETFSFTKDSEDITRKYVPISHLSIAGFSTQASGQGRYATNAIDGNYNTNWHSAWNGTDTERYLIVKIDKPIYLSELEYIPGGGGNGKILDGTIYGSEDGENWTELKKVENLTYTGNVNAYDHGLINTKHFTIENPKKVSYIKIKADRASNGNWFVITMLNLYEDASKLPKNPTASISYSTTKSTSDDVIARLVNPSTKIKVTNNKGSDTYKFTKNGSFTFEFVDEYGHKGTAEAKVDWIDKDIPTADINYNLDSNNKLVVFLDDISEDVYLLDKNNKKLNFIQVNNNKKVSSISYLGNDGRATKTYELDEFGIITKVIYRNTTDSAPNIESYITNIRNGVVKDEEFIDAEGNSVEAGDTYINDAGETVTVLEEDLNALKALQQPITSPLEYTFDNSGDYEFKFMDKANNIAFKSIKVDYISNSNKILASDITYNITKLTNKDVIATINPFIIEGGIKNTNVVLLDNMSRYAFKENGTYTFKYKTMDDINNWEVKEHIAKVDWIDKVAPTAEVTYSTTELTDKVVSTLTNESETIKIINNNGSRQHTFTENGSFVYVIEDLAGNEAEITATVRNIKEITTKPIDTEPKDPTDNDSNNTDDKVTEDNVKDDLEDTISNPIPKFTYSVNKQTNYSTNQPKKEEVEEDKTKEEEQEIKTPQEIKEFEKKKKKIDSVLIMDFILVILIALLVIRIVLYKKQSKKVSK